MATPRRPSRPRHRSTPRRGGYQPTRGLLAGRTFPTEYRYRVALAQAQGFDSPRAKRIRPTPIRTSWQYEALDAVDRLIYERALLALKLSRQNPTWSLKRAAKAAGTTLEQVLPYIGQSFRRTTTGRFRAKPRDQLLRRLQLPTPRGLIAVDVTDSRTASTIGQYWNAIKRYVRTGNERTFWPFRHKIVRVGKIAYRLLTDPTTLRQLLEADVVSPESIYRDTV